MILKHIYESSIAQSAYLVGCPATGEALIVDPTIDIQPYIDAAAAEGLRITGVVETHIHADYVSGARALALATGATLYVSGEGGPDWQYAFVAEPGVRVLHDGDVIERGTVRFEARHTPGHTPEHLMYVLTDTAASQTPLGALTGDFLFVGDVGRPDLLETAAGQIGTMDASARRLYASVRALVGGGAASRGREGAEARAALPDYLLIWPGHGAGSACGRSLGAVPVSSLGYERVTNWALRDMSEEAFVNAVLADQPDPPMYFAEMKRINREGGPLFAAKPLAVIDPAGLRDALATDVLVIDVRAEGIRAWLPGALVVPIGRSFAAWAGSVLPADAPFVLLATDEREAAEAQRVLALVGRTSARGWVGPAAIASYLEQGGGVEEASTIESPRPGQTIIDVRTTAEWRTGHLDGAVHVPLARLPERAARLDRSTPLMIYCQAGTRAVVAATALRRLGFADVTILEGGLEGFNRRHQHSPVIGCASSGPAGS